MLGLITGDIVGSPYRQDNILNEDFKLFDANVRQFYRKKDRDWSEVSVEAQMTRNVVPALAVMHWLQYSPEFSVEDLVSDLQDYGARLSDLAYGGPDAASLAFLPLGTFAEDEAQLSDLQVKVYQAIRECNSRNNGVDRDSVFKFSDADFSVACSLSEAVFKVAQGFPKEDLRLWSSGLFGGSLGAGESDVREGSVKEGDVHEHREFGWSFIKDNVKDNSLQRSFYAAMYSFLYSDNYEKGLRKAVSMGGCSPTVAAIYSAIGQIAYGGVTPQIAAQAEQFLDSDIHSLVSKFESKHLAVQHYTDSLELPEDVKKAEFEEKANTEGKSYVNERQHRDMSKNTVEVIVRQGYEPIYLVPEDRKDLRDFLLKEKKVRENHIQDPSQRDSLMLELMPESRDETYISSARPELTTMYFYGGKLLSVSGTADKAVTTDLDLRKRIRYCFNEFKERVRALTDQVQMELGMSETRYVHFATAAYAEVDKDRVCIYKGVGADGRDNLLAEVRIDDKTGLLRLKNESQGLEFYENGVFDEIHAQLFVPTEAFYANSKDRALFSKNYSDDESRRQHLDALEKGRKMEMLKLEKFYNVQPLQDVYQAIENCINDISTAQDARLERDRRDRNTGSPYDFEGRKTNLDLMNEDLSNTQDPVLQRETWGGMKI